MPFSSSVPVAASSVRPEDPRARVVVLVGQHLERDGEREELAERVPAQVVLLDELLDVLGRRAARAGLEQPAAVHQRHDREHLRARPELQDREQVGEVVAQHVAGDGDRVLAVLGAAERELRRLGDGHDLDLDAVGVVLGQVGLDLLEHLGVVRAGLVEPEHDGRAGRLPALDGEPDPVGDRRVLGLAARARCRPASTSCSSSASPSEFTTRTVPADSISNVLSWLPYSSAFCAIRPTLGVVPIVAGSNAPFSRQKSIVSAYSAA